jgi:hypothetical protein
MRVRILGAVGTAVLVAGLLALAAPQAGAEPDSDPSTAPRLVDTSNVQLPLHRSAPRPAGTARISSRALVVNVTSCAASDLIAAITAVNATGGTVNLLPGCIYTLTSANNDSNGLPVINNAVTVNGAGDTITRSSATLFRIFEVDAPGNLTLNNLTLSNGHSPNLGGAILVAGAATLTLNVSTVTNNTADARGGGIFSGSGTVNVNTSTLSGNTASRAGALEADNGSLTFNSSTIVGNTATGALITGFGGGVLSLLNTAIFNSTRIMNNTGVIGGGIAVAATTTLNSSPVSGNTATFAGIIAGGGIYNENMPLNLNSSPVTGNHATGAGSRGGGIVNRFAAAVATLRSSPVTFNTATDNAGGIFNNGGTVNLISSPVVNNIPNNCVTSAPAIPGCPN